MDIGTFLFPFIIGGMNTIEIVKKIQRKEDVGLFSDLLRRYERMIYKIIDGFDLNNGAFRIDKDELFQEGSVALYNAAKAYDEDKGASFTTFAYKVIYNNIVSKIRDAKRSAGKDLYSIDTLYNVDYSRAFSVADDCVAYVRDVEFKSDYERFLNTLDAFDKAVISLRGMGYSYKQIAEKLEVSEKKVDNRLVAIKKKMKVFLKLG